MRAWETVSQVYSTTHTTSIWAGILERHIASGLKELQGSLVLKKSHNRNVLAPVGSAGANKHSIFYIYSTTGKMLKLEMHQPVKWLRHGQSLKNGSPNNFFPYWCWSCQRYSRFGLQEAPRKEPAELASPWEGSAQILHQQQGWGRWSENHQNMRNWAKRRQLTPTENQQR